MTRTFRKIFDIVAALIIAGIVFNFAASNLGMFDAGAQERAGNTHKVIFALSGNSQADNQPGW